LVAKPKGKRTLEKTWRRSKNNINMDLKEVQRYVVDSSGSG
jgi:hypothetical protein